MSGLFFYVPFGASAVAPLAIAIAVAVGGIAGFSIFRSFVPVNIETAMRYFSSCWSCDLFSEILSSLSSFIPKIYNAIGSAMIPMAAGLTFIYFTWLLLSDYIKVKDATNPWQITSTFGVHAIKLAVVVALFAFPLPKFMATTFIEPIMSTGLALSNIARQQIQPDDHSFSGCMVVTAIQDDSVGEQAFAPTLRHNLTCHIAEFHKLTAIGMTTGWTVMNMAFNVRYMWLHVFPNIFLILAGFALIIMFLWALLPVPIYFLEVFIGLALDLVMLPFFLLGWLFSEWGIFPKGANGKGIRNIIDDAVKNTCGLALVGLFTGFAVLFLSEAVGDIDGQNALITAIQNNDSIFLMDGLTMNNSSILNLVLSGLFIGMFMNSVPNLIEKLFDNKALGALGAEKIMNDIKGVATSLYKTTSEKIKSVKAKPDAAAPKPAASAAPSAPAAGTAK